jgi:hypothetical protein
VHATQTKEFARDKLLACGLGAVCAGMLVGCIYMDPAVGLATGLAFFTASGVKAAYDYTNQMPDVLCGYILQELLQLNALQIQNNNVQLAIK